MLVWRRRRRLPHLPVTPLLHTTLRPLNQTIRQPDMDIGHVIALRAHSLTNS